MYYTCEKCKYTFEADEAVQCVDCGSKGLRKSSGEEIEKYFEYRKIIAEEDSAIKSSRF